MSSAIVREWSMPILTGEPPGEDVMGAPAKAKGDAFDVIDETPPQPEVPPSREQPAALRPPSRWLRAVVRLQELWQAADYEPLELALSIATVMLGAILLLPFDTFGSAPAFATLRGIAPEWLWGLVTVTPGLLAVVAAVYELYWLRLLCILAHVFWWLFVGTLLCTGNPYGFAWAFVWWGLVWLWPMWRHAQQWESRAGDTPTGRALRAVMAVAVATTLELWHLRYRIALRFRELLLR